MTTEPDYWVDVCSACRTASCWHCEFVCWNYRGAGIVAVRASELIAENNEHPSNFSREKLMAVCGSVREAT